MIFLAWYVSKGKPGMWVKCMDAKKCD